MGRQMSLLGGHPPPPRNPLATGLEISNKTTLLIDNWAHPEASKNTENRKNRNIEKMRNKKKNWNDYDESTSCEVAAWIQKSASKRTPERTETEENNLRKNLTTRVRSVFQLLSNRIRRRLDTLCKTNSKETEKYKKKKKKKKGEMALKIITYSSTNLL